MKLPSRTALVTGGASGLGEATARRLVAAGARVAVLDIDVERGGHLARECGANMRFFETNVTSEESVQAAIDAARAAFGSIEICVNSAGIGAPQRTLGREGPASFPLFKKVVEINLIGTFNVTRLAAAAMAGNVPDAESGERGIIINTASIAAFEGQMGQASYSASKGGIVSMTLPIARDLAPLGIRCMTIAPGIFKTPILRGLTEEIVKSLAANIPFPQRLGAPEEYASLVQYIVESPYLNGETIRLDAATRLTVR